MDKSKVIAKVIEIAHQLGSAIKSVSRVGDGVEITGKNGRSMFFECATIEAGKDAIEWTVYKNDGAEDRDLSSAAIVDHTNSWSNKVHGYMDKAFRQGYMASEVIAAPSGFTKLTPLKLKPEGSTMNSLANAKEIMDAGYNLVRGSFAFDIDHADYNTSCEFMRGDEIVIYTFKGFSAFYGGEGPRGMVSFLKIFSWPVNEDKVFLVNPPSHAIRGSVNLTYFK